jgi:hypothetical protein
VAGGAASENRLDALFDLEKALVLQLFDSLGVRLTTEERNAIEQRPTRSLQAFLAYSRGLRLEDQGRYDEASRNFNEAVRLDPGFGAARQKGAETSAAAVGLTVSPAVVEANLVGTPEGGVTQASLQGEAPKSNTGGDNGANNTANNLNPSNAGGATGGAGAGGGSTPNSTPPAKDPLAAATGNEGPAKTANVTIIVKVPSTKP